MPDLPPVQTQGAELLTIRDVARLLKIKPDTLYRWVKRGQLPGVKIGKEWRIPRSDVEKFVGRSLSYAYIPDFAENGQMADSAVEDPMGEKANTASAERQLHRFLKARDHVLALATKKSDLAAVEEAFWRVALSSGGMLLVLHTSKQTKPLRKALKDLGIDTRAYRNDGRLNLVEVKDAEEARRVLHLEASRGRPVWATFGFTNSLQIPREQAVGHAHELDAACVTCNAIILEGHLISRKEWSYSDTWRLEAEYRGLIRVVDDELLFARYS